MSSMKEKTFGYFPPAKDIRQRNRRNEIQHARQSLEKLWEKERNNEMSMKLEPVVTQRNSNQSADPFCRYGGRNRNSADQAKRLGTLRKPQREGIVKMVEHSTNMKGQIKTKSEKHEPLVTRILSPLERDVSEIFESLDKRRAEKRRLEKELERFDNDDYSTTSYFSVGSAGKRSNQSSARSRSTKNTELDSFKIQHTDSLMASSSSPRSRHFFVSPDWVSEHISIKQMSLANRPNPMKYGWI